tara:strand:- start:21 stop:497 length:477 start_codon:yes stop_codon:yes gene_type:complete
MSKQKIKVGKKVPTFSLPSTGNKILKLSDLKGKNIIIYFYPKDATPGCTIEGQNFRDNIRKFSSRNTIVLGVSRDKINSHEKFKKNQKFPFDLLSDEDETLCKIFDVIKEKNMYGKKFIGIERSTFLIDEKGILRKEWRKVKVKDHVEEVLTVLKEIK